MTKSLGSIAAIGLVLAVTFFIIAATVSPDHNLRLVKAPKGPSHQSSRQWAWDGGDRLEINLPASVTLVPGGTPSVIVRGDQDILQRVNFEHGQLSGDDGDDCFIPFICGNSDRHSVTVELHGIQLKELRVNGVARVDMGHLDQDRLTLRLSGAGKVEGEGRMDDLNISISGAGDASFGGLAVGHAKVTLSGVGNAEISPSQEADITISGVGNVRLDTKPERLTTDISGLGNVNGPGAKKSKDEDNDGQPPEPPQTPEPPRHRGDDLGRQIRDQVRAQVREQVEQTRGQVRQQVDESLKQQGLK